MSAQLDRLKKRLDRIPQKVKEAVKPTLIEAGNELVDTMKQLAPVRTGALRDSITATPPGETTPPYSEPGGSRAVPENQVVITAGNTDVRYAHLVEYGTSKAHAQPFFWPAYRSLKDGLKRQIKDAIKKAVRS